MGYKKGDKFQTAFDTYTLEEQVGSGGSGTVYRVRSDEGLSAIKVLDPLKASAEKLKRFKNEIHFCSRNTDKNIVRVLSSGITPTGDVFYVMPFYHQTLHGLIRNGIAPHNVLPLFSQALDGAESAHLRNVFHRDLKPQNILFDPSSNNLVLADFGIARFEEEDLYTAVETRNDERLANFVYAAPEQLIRNGSVDLRCDVYALGLILNEMFTKNVPRGTDFPRIKDVAPDYAYVDDLVDLMIRNDVNRRIANIAQVKQELIARGNQFVSLQRLNSAKTEVIPTSEIDDPTFLNPINLLGTDYSDGYLLFKLSAIPPEKWIEQFKNQGNYQFVMGKRPMDFRFRQDEALIMAEENNAHLIAGYMPKYVESANILYRQVLIRERNEMMRQRQLELQSKIAEEERRQRVLAKIRSTTQST